MDKEMIKELAEKSNKPESEIQNFYEKTYMQWIEMGLSPENAKERAIRRTQLALKKAIMRNAKNENTPGFILGKTKAYDTVKKIREKTRLFIKKYGLEKAINEGYANAKGDYLFNDYDWRKGKVIPEEAWEAKGLALITNKGKTQLASIKFRDNVAQSDYNLFTNCDMRSYTKRDINNLFEVIMTLPPENFEEDQIADLSVYEDQIKASAGDRYLSNLAELNAFYDKYGNEFFSWCIIKADILELSPTRSGNIVVKITDDSIDGTIAAFLREDCPLEFCEYTENVTFVANTFKNDYGEVCLSILGYWVEPDLRFDNSNLKVPDIKNPWGGINETEDKAF